MSTRFLLVRHATCAPVDQILLGRALNAPLDATGRCQALALAERIRHESPLRVESSPRRRAMQTARAIATATHCRLHVAAQLDELDFGRWAGHTFEELERDRGWLCWNRDRDHAHTPAGVDIRGVQRRTGRYLATLARSCTGATVVLVTHTEIIRSIVLRCIGSPAGDYPRIVIDPASITRIVVDRRGMRLEKVNQAALPS